MKIPKTSRLLRHRIRDDHTPIHFAVARNRLPKITNLSLLTSLFTIPAAISFLAQDPECKIDGLLAAGHVCSITGLREYDALAEKLELPIAVTGFEPADLLYGIYQVIRLKAQGIDRTINAYRRAVPAQGNKMARQRQSVSSHPMTPIGGDWERYPSAD